MFPLSSAHFTAEREKERKKSMMKVVNAHKKKEQKKSVYIYIIVCMLTG